jgi:hypothetical protein
MRTCRIDGKGEEGGLFGGAFVCGGTSQMTASAHHPWILRPLGGGRGRSGDFGDAVAYYHWYLCEVGGICTVLELFLVSGFMHILLNE